MLLSNLTQNPNKVNVINNTTPPAAQNVKQEKVELCEKVNDNNSQEPIFNNQITSAEILAEKSSIKNCLNLPTKLTTTPSTKIKINKNNSKIYKTSSCIGVATDFSIAAIMARGGNASSREPSERSLSE